jgi:uncharacterized protein (TIGR02145 family)
MKEVKIANQIWMAENLDTDKFRNGEIISESKSEEEWKKRYSEGEATWCYYNFDSSYGAKYGKIYNLHAIMDERCLAPEGWHIPNDSEWEQLALASGGAEDAGKLLKSSSGWTANGNGSKKGVFNALPGGQLIISKLVTGTSPFCHEFDKCSFWSKTKNGKAFKWSNENNNIYWSLIAEENTFFREVGGNCGLHVRCLRD